MADILYSSLKSEFDRKIGDDDDVAGNMDPLPAAKNVTEPDNVWRCITFVTQDYDVLTEFIFKFKVRLENRLAYFDPDHYWAYIRIPKIKLKYGEQVYQTRIGVKTYNVLSGVWREGRFLPVMEAGTSCEITPLVPVPKEQQVTTVLVPYGNTVAIVEDPDPGFKIPLSCKYAITYYNIAINHNGIYVNRKYRDVPQLKPVTGDYLVLEPKAYQLKDAKNNILCLSI